MEVVTKPNPKYAAQYKYIEKIRQTDYGKELSCKHSRASYDRHKEARRQHHKEYYQDNEDYRKRKIEASLNRYYEKKALKWYQDLFS